jgi:hypothetical protein
MKKKITYDDFEELVGPMNSVALEDAICYTGLHNRERLTQDDIRTILAKKNKIIKSDIKRQRAMSKMALKMDWD